MALLEELLDSNPSLMAREAVAAALKKLPEEFEAEGLPRSSQVRSKFNAIKSSRKRLRSQEASNERGISRNSDHRQRSWKGFA